MSDSSQLNNDEIPTIAQQSNIEKSSRLSINAREFVPTSMTAPAIATSAHVPSYQPNSVYNAAATVPVNPGAIGQVILDSTFECICQPVLLVKILNLILS